VIVHPKNANTVLVAAMGHAFGPNANAACSARRMAADLVEGAVSPTTKTGAIDVEFDANNPNVVFAALYQCCANPGCSKAAARAAPVPLVRWRRHMDAIAGERPAGGLLGRITISVSGADSNRVYAMVEAEKGDSSALMTAETNGS